MVWLAEDFFAVGIVLGFVVSMLGDFHSWLRSGFKLELNACITAAFTLRKLCV